MKFFTIIFIIIIINIINVIIIIIIRSNNSSRSNSNFSVGRSNTSAQRRIEGTANYAVA